MTAGGGITNFSTLEVDGPVTATDFLLSDGLPAPGTGAPAVSQGITPRLHLPTFGAAANPVWVHIGDSVSTGNDSLIPQTVVEQINGANSLTSSETLWGVLKRVVRAQNPDKSIDFYNRAIGGQKWSTLASGVVTSNWPDWYTVHGSVWLSYVESLAPDVVTIALGANDAHTLNPVNIQTALATICAFAKVPDIIIFTNWQSDPDGWDPITILGMKSAMAYQRTMVLGNFPFFTIPNLPYVGLVDVGRYQQMILNGVDIADQALLRVVQDVSYPTGGTVVLPATEGDFFFDITWPASGGAAALPTITVQAGKANSIPTVAVIALFSANQAVAHLYSGPNALISGAFFSGNVANPNLDPNGGAAFDMRISLSIQNGYVVIAANGQVFCEGYVGYFGAAYTPNLLLSGGNSTKPYTINAYAIGVPRPMQRSITANAMVGELNGPTGGNGGVGGGAGDNHPGSYGIRDIFAPVIEGQNWASPAVEVSATTPSYFGIGSDGALVISSGTTTLTHDAQYTDLTISGTGKLNTAGYKVYVSGTLDLSAAGARAIYNAATAGNSASSATGATGAATSQLSPSTSLWQQATAGLAGGSGGTGVGTAGSNGATVVSVGGTAPAAGAGGAAASAGGAGGTIATATQFSAATLTINPIGQMFQTAGNRLVPGLNAPGGGGGGGDGVNAGGGGGGGGMGGLHVYISANIIARGTNATASIIQAIGGLGGNGANGVAGNTGGGGGGSGGGGGFVQIVAGSLTGTAITSAIDVSGGKAGNGGNGVGTGLGGLIVNGASGGGAMLAVLSPPSFTQLLQGNSVVGSAGTAPSGATGGTGGLGAVARANL